MSEKKSILSEKRDARKRKAAQKQKETVAKRIAESEDLWDVEEVLEEFAETHGAEYLCTIIFKFDPVSAPYQAIFKKGEIAEKIFREKFRRVQEYQFSVRKP
jgi:hypothetical protein